MNNKHSFDEKQRFSLRKLTVGLASVLIGLTFFTATQQQTQTVHAAVVDGIDHEQDGDYVPEAPVIDPNTGEPKHETIDVGFDAQDQDQTIHYHTSDGQPAKDKDGNPVPDGHVTGKTDDMNKDVPMPNGYVPKTPGTDDKTNLTNPDPDTGKVPDKTVTVEHGQHTTAPGETHNVGDPITPNPDDKKDAKVPGNTYQQAITDQDVKKDLTRTVTINKPKADGNTVIVGNQQQIDYDKETKSSTVSYHRTTTVDDVTGKVTGHGAWQLVDPKENQFAGVTVPQFAGYTATITDGEGHTLTSIDKVTTSDPSYKDPKISIAYKANSQSRNYVFEDGGKTVVQKAISGVTDQTVDPSTQLDDVMNTLKGKGYDLSKIKLGDNYKFKASGNTNNIIDLSGAHGFKDVKPGDKIPDGVTDPNKSGSDKHVANSDVTETVTRHITFHDPTHENSTSVQDRHVDQTVTLKRGFTYDTVTNAVTKYGDWTTQAVPAVEVPKVAGYNATVTGTNLQDGKIAGDTLRDGYQDPKIEVTYTATDSTQTIHYVDENGHELSATDNKDQNGDVIKDSTVTVKTDEVGNVQVPKGWKLVDDHDKTTKVAYDSDGTIPVKNVAITHATIEVTPDKPHTAGDPIDPKVPTGSKYGAGLTSDDLNTTGYRCIHFRLPASTNAANYAQRLRDSGLTNVKVDGQTVTVDQTVAYSRTAVVDAITGEVKGYNPAGVHNKGWMPDANKLVNAYMKGDSAYFKQVLIQQINGYKAKLDKVETTTLPMPNGAKASMTQLFVSFMAIPTSKDDNSSGVVDEENTKQDTGKPINDKPGVTPVKDLDKDDQKKIEDNTKPDAGKGNQDHKTDETKPQAKPDAGKGNQDHKTDETKPQAKPDAGKGTKPGKTDGTKPGKADNTKLGKKAHVSPTRGHNSGANKKNSKITNTAASASDKSNRNTPIGSANDEANKTNRTVQAAVVNNDKNVLPQTGASQNKTGIIGMVFASLAGMLGLAGTKKKRKND